MDSFIQENMGYLGRHARLVGLMQSIVREGKKGEYELQPARNQSPTLVVKQGNDRVFTYHSKYDPQAEAKKQVGSAPETSTHIMLFGMGLGYGLEEVLCRLAPPALLHQVIVIEPDPWVFSHALYSRDLKKVLSDSRVDWCVHMTPDEFGEFWHASLDWAAMKDLAIIEHPPSLARFPEFFERIKEKLRYFGNRSRGNLVTLMHAGSEFLTNNFLNMDALVHYPGVSRLFGTCKGMPGIVVAAGPSLDKNAHLLKQVKGRFPIIAVDTALRPLIARGIRPDIVVAGDPSYLNSLDFVGMEGETDIILAFEPMTHPDIPRFFRGPKLLMSFGGGVAPWLEKYREKVGYVGCWGSIATTAFDLVRSLGCDPIVFVGLDLSFQDGRLHVSGSYSDDIFWDKLHSYTSIEHETVDYIATRGVHQLKRANGEVVFTDQSMFLYRNWFEDQFRQSGPKIINATEGGIVERFAENIPLSEVLSRYAHMAGGGTGVLHRLVQEQVSIDFQGLTGELTDILGTLRVSDHKAREGLTLCRKLNNAEGRTPVASLTGQATLLMRDIMDLHDRLCDQTQVYAWLTVWNTRFTTRHHMEINSLKNKPQALVSEWIEELRAYFETMVEFYSYLTPLIEAGLCSIRDEQKKLCPTGSQGGCGYGVS